MNEVAAAVQEASEEQQRWAAVLAAADAFTASRQAQQRRFIELGKALHRWRETLPVKRRRKTFWARLSAIDGVSERQVKRMLKGARLGLSMDHVELYGGTTKALKALAAADKKAEAQSGGQVVTPWRELAEPVRSKLNQAAHTYAKGEPQAAAVIVGSALTALTMLRETLEETK